MKWPPAYLVAVTRLFATWLRSGPKLVVVVLLTMATLASSSLSLSAEAQQRPDAVSTYLLDSGDVISVRVFGEDDFTRDKVRLTDAGTVSFPMLGEIPVLGRTVGELETLITDRLKGRYLVNPRVSVWIDEYRSFFVNGMVEKPGAYSFQPGLNVRKAVSIAGGLKERASEGRIFVVRDKDPLHKSIRVDLDAQVNPGDTITVGESFF